MNDVLKIAKQAKITDGKNKIMNDALANTTKEDKVVKQLSRELAELVINIMSFNKSNKMLSQ